MSFNYLGLTISSSLSFPFALILAAFVETLVLGYLVFYSRFQGWREWLVAFSVLYIGNYVLTAMESLYLASVLTIGTVESIIVNGAVISGVFAFVAVRLLGPTETRTKGVAKRLAMPLQEWIWKILACGAVYLFLFIVIGFAVYGPIASYLNHAAYLAEQSSIPVSAAGLVFPLEFVRGVIWTALAIVSAISLPFTWRKTALTVGLLLALPVSLSIFLSGAIAPGLQAAHFVELLVENLIFGIIAVWFLHLRSRLTILSGNESAKTHVKVTS
jgi:hypothetical protein